MNNGFKYNGIKFSSLKEFQSIQEVAFGKGIETTEQFNIFLKENYN